MSFVNLLANDVWTENNIVNRQETIVRSVFSAAAERNLNRAIRRVSMGEGTLTEDEESEKSRFAQVTASAQQAGDDARADMALLLQAMAVERAERVVASPGATPEDIEAAQAVIDEAQYDVLALVKLRRPGEPS